MQATIFCRLLSAQWSFVMFACNRSHRYRSCRAMNCSISFIRSTPKFSCPEFNLVIFDLLDRSDLLYDPIKPGGFRCNYLWRFKVDVQCCINGCVYLPLFFIADDAELLFRSGFLQCSGLCLFFYPVQAWPAVFLRPALTSAFPARHSFIPVSGSAPRRLRS